MISIMFSAVATGSCLLQYTVAARRRHALLVAAAQSVCVLLRVWTGSQCSHGRQRRMYLNKPFTASRL